MNQQEMINAIARKLYRFSRQEVAEVIEVMLEVWREELARPEGYIHLSEMGKLYVECQHIPTTGVVFDTLVEKHGVLRAPRRVPRLYFRFRPAERFKQAVLAARSLTHE